MNRIGRSSVVLLILGLLLTVLVVPAVAQEGGDDEGSQSTPISADLEPAVPIPADSPTNVLPDWTYRYMVPTTLLLAAVVILFTSVRYFTNVVRRRYRIVEE